MSQSLTRPPRQDDSGNAVDAFTGAAMLVHLRPFLDRADLHALAPGATAPVVAEDVFDWTRNPGTREVFWSAFGRELGDRVLDVAVSRGWRFVSWRQENGGGDTGDIYEFGPFTYDSGPLDEARRQQREYLKGTWVKGSPLGTFLGLDKPDGARPHPEVLEAEKRRERNALKKTWIAGTPIGDWLNLNAPDPATPSEPAPPASFVNYDASGPSSDPADALSVNALGIDLYQQVRRQNAGNLALSPLSVFGALAMALLGARGQTAAQMKHVLYLDGSTFEGVEQAIRLVSVYEVTRPGITLRIANRLFGDSTYTFQPRFLDQARRLFGAQLDPVPFKGAPERARGHINGWVAEQTENRIKNLLPAGAVDDATRLVLANAILLPRRLGAALRAGGDAAGGVPRTLRAEPRAHDAPDRALPLRGKGRRQDPGAALPGRGPGDGDRAAGRR